jgi:hypothetical protein
MVFVDFENVRRFFGHLLFSKYLNNLVLIYIGLKASKLEQ